MAHGRYKGSSDLICQSRKLIERRLGKTEWDALQMLLPSIVGGYHRRFNFLPALGAVEAGKVGLSEKERTLVNDHRMAVMDGRDVLMNRIYGKQVAQEHLFAFQRAVLAVTEDGHYMEICAGMDCDGVQFRYCTRYETPVRWADWVALYERTYDINRFDCNPAIWFGRPSHYDEEHVTRDRALEAHENGHAWSVVKGAL